MPAITMPKLSDTMTEGTLVRWLKKKGDKVSTGDVLAEIETDKATMEMEAFDDGVLTEVFVQEGQKAAIGDKIALVLAKGESADAPVEKPAPKAEAKSDAPAPKPASAPASAAAAPSTDRVKASPLAKKVAAERGVSLEGVVGSGPGGRIVEKDVPQAGSAPRTAATAAPAPIKLEKTGGDEKRIELSGMRRIIAERLLASKTQIPHFDRTISSPNV